MKRPGAAIAAIFAVSLIPMSAENPAPAPQAWRSALYPEDWTPEFRDAEGRFLHDFSYAGYHSGEKAIPEVAGPVLDVTAEPFGADATGANDATAGIQAALDKALEMGGAVVFLPAGTYRVRPPEGKNSALVMRGSGIVLRGAGAHKTFIFNDTPQMREKNVIQVAADDPADWHNEQKTVVTPLRGDLPNVSTVVPVESVEGFAVGDLVALRADHTDRFIEEHGMTGKWKAGGSWSPNRTLLFCRRIVAIDPAANTVTIDIPTRYPMKTADLARMVKIRGTELRESGLEDFAIGMAEHPADGWDENDYNTEGLGSYDAHSSRAIALKFVEDCWVRRVHTYCPPGNTKGRHILSNTLNLYRCRKVTVRDCDFRHTQSKTGGGNGYHYTLMGSDCLVTACRAEDARHNYDIGSMPATGNAIVGCLTKDGRLASDFHMYLSMANLFDTMTCDGDFLEARAMRPWGWPQHGLTTTQSVFWNTLGLRYSPERDAIVWSQQYGHGYVIGTRGPACKVDSDDFVEGVCQGDGLVPQSLYADQLARRVARSGGRSPSP